MSNFMLTITDSVSKSAEGPIGLLGLKKIILKVSLHIHCSSSKDPSASVLIPTCTETLGPANSSRIFTKSMKKKVRTIVRAEEAARHSETRGGEAGGGRRNDQTVVLLCTIEHRWRLSHLVRRFFHSSSW
jgi:hypothetical protein